MLETKAAGQWSGLDVTAQITACIDELTGNSEDTAATSPRKKRWHFRNASAGLPGPDAVDVQRHDGICLVAP